MKMKKLVLALTIAGLVSVVHAGGTDGGTAGFGNDTAVGPSSAASSMSGTNTAVGGGAQAVTLVGQATAMGNNASAAATGATATGANSSASGINAVADGWGANASGNMSVASGAQSRATGTLEYSVGDASINLTRRITNVSAGTGSNDAANFGQVQTVDVKAAAAQVQATATAQIISSGLPVNSVQIGSGTVATRSNTVSVGGRQIADVAAPIAGTDAANKDYVDQAVATVSIAPPDLTGIHNDIRNLDDKINKVEKTVSGGVAMAMAMASPVMLAPGESAVSLGLGEFNGQAGFALSAAHSIERDPETVRKSAIKDISLSAGLGASSAGQVGVRFGVTLKF